jgi:hypothetical protein
VCYIVCRTQVLSAQASVKAIAEAAYTAFSEPTAQRRMLQVPIPANLAALIDAISQVCLSDT